MRTVTFKSVLYGALTGLGQEPYASTPSAADQLRMLVYLNERVRIAWEHAWWPELMRTEERFYRADWAAGTAYTTGQEVYLPASEMYYVALQNGTNKNPATETAYWAEQDEMDRYVAWEQTGKTAIGTVRSIGTRNWRTSSYPGFMDFSLSENGIQVSALAGNSVWIDYRLRPAVYSVTAWAGGTTYAAGDVVYYDTTGECYVALAASTNKNPATETASWQKLDFPKIFARYVALGCWADGLAVDKQGTRWTTLDQADKELGRVVLVEIDGQGLTQRAQVRTY